MLDEKGRLFGKINIIDLLVVLLVLVVAAVVAIKLLGGGDGLPGAEGTTYLLPSSSRMIAPTFRNCSALARELPPNFTTFFII